MLFTIQLIFSIHCVGDTFAVQRKAVFVDGVEYKADAVFDRNPEDVAQFTLAPLVRACSDENTSALLWTECNYNELYRVYTYKAYKVLGN